MKKLFQKKLSFVYIFVFIIISSGTTYLIMQSSLKVKNAKLKELTDNINTCNYNIMRLKGYPLISPLMFVDTECEGANLASTKAEIEQIIQNYKTFQGVSSVSVYLRDFSDNQWLCVNENEKYEPGSLFKVPILLAYLKMNEITPGVLNKELLYSQPFAINKDVAFKSKSIQLGSKYKVKELLNYMIEYSDNNATALLNNNLKPEVLIKLFTDLEMEPPVIDAQQYLINTKQYSYFMRAIYNASYLTINDSEYAAELLGKCEFKNGIVRGLPENTKIIHKFGESGNPEQRQLHETAIVYISGKEYLITVMTKGKETQILSKVIGEISQIVYKNMVQKSYSSI
jgi:beta-lactamase class A